MSRIRDLFIASVHVLKSRPKLLNECLKEAENWKKIGELTAADYDLIIATARGIRVDLSHVK